MINNSLMIPHLEGLFLYRAKAIRKAVKDVLLLGIYVTLNCIFCY